VPHGLGLRRRRQVGLVPRDTRDFMGGVYDAQNLAAGKERSIALARKAVARM
jgi:hypothetical protein